MKNFKKHFKKYLSVALVVAVVLTGIAGVVGSQNKLEVASINGATYGSSTDTVSTDKINSSSDVDGSSELGLYNYSSSNNYSSKSENVSVNESTGEETQESDSNLPQSASQTAPSTREPSETGRKIIRNASLSLSTEKYNETISSIEKKVSELEGYIESSDETKYDDYTYTRITARVPEESLDTFLSSVSGYATVTSKSISSDDVTLTYVDNESHLNALRTEEETLMGLLEKASSLSDVITIEDKLTSVRSEIEYYQSALNRLDNEIEYSTVEITIDEVSHESETGEGFWAEILAGLKESLYDIGEGFKSIFSWVIINIPYLVIFVVIFVVAYAIIRKKFKQRRNKSGRQADSDAVLAEE